MLVLQFDQGLLCQTSFGVQSVLDGLVFKLLDALLDEHTCFFRLVISQFIKMNFVKHVGNIADGLHLLTVLFLLYTYVLFHKLAFVFSFDLLIECNYFVFGNREVDSQFFDLV